MQLPVTPSEDEKLSQCWFNVVQSNNKPAFAQCLVVSGQYPKS